jgi:hypothetical protein
MKAHFAPVLIAFASLACAQVPDQDIRNTQTPNTDTHFTFKTPASLEEWEARKAHLRTQILASAGLLPMPEKTALNPEIFGKIDRQTYTVEKTLLETLPGYFLGGNLYRPTTPGKHPAVLVTHGHWQYGRLENQQLCSTQALSATLARLGFVVFMYDMVGYNDTIQTPHRFGDDDRQRLWSFGPLGLQLWNSTRVIDFLESLPEVDPQKIGMAGASGGATQTLLAMAVDDRLHFLSPVNMISGYMQGGDLCENAPGLRLGTNNIEIGSMAAPRPMLVVSATGDWTKHVPKEEFPEIQRLYQLYGKQDSVEVIQINEQHNINQASREAVERFFDKTVLNDPKAADVSEGEVHIEELQDMLALQNRPLRSGALNYDQVFELWRTMATRQMQAVNDTDQLRSILTSVLHVEWPANVIAGQAQGSDRLTLGRRGVGDRVPALFHRGNKNAVLLLNPDGAEAAMKAAQTKSGASHGNTTLAIDAFQTGSAVAPRDRSHEHFLAFNLTDDGNRVQDILTALKYLSDQHVSTIEIDASGKAAWWAAYAAAVAPRDVNIKLNFSAQTLAPAEQSFVTDFNVPGVLRAGGLDTVQRLLKASNREGNAVQ